MKDKLRKFILFTSLYIFVIGVVYACCSIENKSFNCFEWVNTGTPFGPATILATMLYCGALLNDVFDIY